MFGRFTRKEIEERYGVPFKEGYAMFAECASRTTPDESVEDCHAWDELMVPLDDGTFNLIAPGMFSEFFPVGFFETLLFVFRTHKAQLSLADFNEYYCHRDKTYVPYPPMSKERFDNFMEKDLKGDLKASKAGKLKFQAQGDNCAYEAESLGNRLYPEFNLKPYDLSFEKVILPSGLMPLVSARKLFPNFDGWNVFRRVVCFILGAWQPYEFTTETGTKETTSLFENPFWRKGNMKLPAHLFERKKEMMDVLWQNTEQPVSV